MILNFKNFHLLKKSLQLQKNKNHFWISLMKMVSTQIFPIPSNFILD